MLTDSEIIRKITGAFWSYKNIDIESFNHYKDEDVVFVIQNEFIEHCKMFKYICDNCSFEFTYEEYEDTLSKINDPLLCKKCGFPLNKSLKNIIKDKFIPGVKENFTSIWMSMFLKRYLKKICSFCPPDEDKLQDYIMAFSRAVLSYNKKFIDKVKFNTYFWRVIHNEACDDSREKGSAKKNPSITCMVCGCKIGKISSEHLMSLKGKFSKGISHEYMGHKKFIDYMYSLYQENIKDLLEKVKNKFVKKKIIHEYYNCFPNSPTEGKNVSLDDSISSKDEELTLKDMIANEFQDPIVFHDNVTVFNDMIFCNDDIFHLKSNFPSLYYAAVSEKKFNNISRKYDNFENSHNSKIAIKEMSKCISIDFCNTDRGYTRKSIFYDKQGNFINSRIFYDVIDLHGQSYPLDVIACFIGYDNLEKDDIKIVLRILGTNQECKNIAEQYLG